MIHPVRLYLSIFSQQEICDEGQFQFPSYAPTHFPDIVNTVNSKIQTFCDHMQV